MPPSARTTPTSAIPSAIHGAAALQPRRVPHGEDRDDRRVEVDEDAGERRRDRLEAGVVRPGVARVPDAEAGCDARPAGGPSRPQRRAAAPPRRAATARPAPPRSRTARPRAAASRDPPRRSAGRGPSPDAKPAAETRTRTIPSGAAAIHWPRLAVQAPRSSARRCRSPASAVDRHCRPPGPSRETHYTSPRE